MGAKPESRLLIDGGLTAIEEEREALGAELVAETGCAVLLTYGAQLDEPLSDGLLWPARFIDQFEGFEQHLETKVISGPARD